MIFAKDQESIKEHTGWVDSLDESDLSVRGWPKPQLLETLRLHPYYYWRSPKQPFMTSCVVFQRLAEDMCEVLFLATSKNEQRQGQMRQLLSHFIAQGPFERIWLECRADNLAAIKLYKTLGFVENGRRDRYYKDGTPAILFAFFRKASK